MTCEACWQWIPEYELTKKVVRTRPHEIRSRGAGGKEIQSNQFILCQSCHVVWHQIGWIEFIKMFDHLELKTRSILGKYWQEDKEKGDLDFI